MYGSGNFVAKYHFAFRVYHHSSCRDHAVPDTLSMSVQIWTFIYLVVVMTLFFTIVFSMDSILIFMIVFSMSLTLIILVFMVINFTLTIPAPFIVIITFFIPLQFSLISFVPIVNSCRPPIREGHWF